MFFRASDFSNGSGLGLYVAKNAIEKLGGKIHLSSALGIGTEVIIEIPNLNPIG
ncbi:MAG TPA: ATP-binding protein [Chryseosolibacter sp.]